MDGGGRPPARARRGRPRRGEEPSFDHHELERVLVHGEFSVGVAGEQLGHRYPSFRELATRFGVSKTIVERFARRHNCLERRVGSGTDRDPTLTPLAPREGANKQNDDASTAQLAREIFRGWVESVHRGDTRITNMGEIEKMIRIAADLEAEAQVRAMIPPGVPTLEEIQDHYERRLREYEATSPGERGEIPIGLGDAGPSANHA